MKKVLCLLLAFVLPLGTLCAAAEDEISILIYGSPLTIPNTDPIIPELNRRLGMNITIEAGDDEALTARVAGGDLPDVMLVSSTSAFSALQENGVLLNITEQIDKMPELRAAFTDVEWAKLSVNGEIFGIPRRPEANYLGWYIRYDWLATLGVEQPTTFDELYDVCVKMRDADLDGNGQNDTYPISGRLDTAFCGFFTAYGTAGWGDIILEDGKPVYCVTTDNFRMAVEEIRRFTEAGLIDPEVVANTFDVMREKMGTGKVGVCGCGWSETGRSTHKEVINAIYPDARWDYMKSLITTPYGTAGSILNASGSNNKFSVFSADLADCPEKLAAIMELYRYITVDEGDILLSFGIEGQHHDVVDGIIVKRPEMDELSYGWAIQITGRQDALYCNTKFPECKEGIDFAATQIPIIYTYDTLVQTPEGYNIADLHAYEEEMVLKFMFGKESMDKWDEFINTLYNVYNLEMYMNSAVEQLTALDILP